MKYMGKISIVKRCFQLTLAHGLTRIPVGCLLYGLILDWPKSSNSLMPNNSYHTFYASNRLAEMQDENDCNAEASVQRSRKK